MSMRRWWMCIGAATLLIGPVMLWLRPEMQTYRGLSGVDSALVALMGTMLLREAVVLRQWRRVSAMALLFAGFAAKMIYEAGTGTTLFVNATAAGFTPIVEAHLAGAVIGVVAAWIPIDRVSRMGIAITGPRARAECARAA